VLVNVNLLSSILSFTGKGHFLFAALVSKILKWAEAHRLVSDKITYAAALESEFRLLEAKEHGFVGQDLQFAPLQ
jgi:dTDP-D-glucose 4,6-dehydratase